MKYKGEEVIRAGTVNSEHLAMKIYTEFAWEVIDVCNYMCSYCGAGYGNDTTRPQSKFFKQDKYHDAWKGVINRLKLIKGDMFVVDLLGGEPTLHPDIHDIISSLEEVKCCEHVRLITNLSKNLDYFKNLCDTETTKLEINPSIHFQYYSEKIVDKILHIHNSTDIRISPIVVLSDDPKHKTNMLHVFETLVDNNIRYSVNFLFPAHGYKPNYTNDFYDTFNKYVNIGCEDTDTLYNITTADGHTHNVTVKDINTHKLTRFKNWNCTPKSWNINVKGQIINSCSKQPLKLGGGNMSDLIKCPKNNCYCNVWWNYDKYK
jgi:organic radical activating enzyme